MSDLLYTAANTLPVWRDLGVTALATLIVGCLWLYASLMDSGGDK